MHLMLLKVIIYHGDRRELKFWLHFQLVSTASKQHLGSVSGLYQHVHQRNDAKEWLASALAVIWDLEILVLSGETSCFHMDSTIKKSKTIWSPKALRLTGALPGSLRREKVL